MFVPSVSGFAAGAARTTEGALQTPPERVDFMMLQSAKTHDAQTTTSPAGETAGLTSLAEGEALRFVSADGTEMLPTMISAEPSPFTNATVSAPSAVAKAWVNDPIWI